MNSRIFKLLRCTLLKLCASSQKQRAWLRLQLKLPQTTSKEDDPVGAHQSMDRTSETLGEKRKGTAPYSDECSGKSRGGSGRSKVATGTHADARLSVDTPPKPQIVLPSIGRSGRTAQTTLKDMNCLSDMWDTLPAFKIGLMCGARPGRAKVPEAFGAVVTMAM